MHIKTIIKTYTQSRLRPTTSHLGNNCQRHFLTLLTHWNHLQFECHVLLLCQSWHSCHIKTFLFNRIHFPPQGQTDVINNMVPQPRVMMNSFSAFWLLKYETTFTPPHLRMSGIMLCYFKRILLHPNNNDLPCTFL